VGTVNEEIIKQYIKNQHAASIEGD